MKPLPFPVSISVISRRSCFSILYISVTAATWTVSAQSPPAKPDQPDQQLLLKDFKPRSMLQVPEHPVEKARFPVIDFHGQAESFDIRMIQH